MNLLPVALLLLFTQSAFIQGIIVKDGGGDPLSKANVALRVEGNDGAVLDSITTGDDGRFQFQNVRPGRYRLIVTRSGYVRPPLTVTITDGQPQPDLRLPMTPAGAIYGRVVDNKGEPLGNIEVQALRPEYPEGRRVLTFVRSVQTNDLGEYRLFWLPPGRYYVVAVHPEAEDLDGRMFHAGVGMTIMAGPRGVFFSSSSNVDPALELAQIVDRIEPQPKTDRYVPVYFPGTIDEQAASAIDVHGGRDLGGVNIVIAPVRARHVRGVIVDGITGRPAQYPSVTLDGFDRPRREEPVDQDNGSFDLLLLPGSHTLTANAVSGEGYAVVQVGDADIGNLTIPTMRPFQIPARIAVDGASVSGSELGELRVSLRRDPPPPRERPFQASYSSPLPNGTFNLEAGPGDFRVNIAPLLNVSLSPFPIKLPRSLQDAYVKSIRLGNVDVLNAGLHLEKPPDATLEIVLGANPGIIEGVVLNDTRQPVVDASVVLLPDARRRTDLYTAATTDLTGRFRFGHVPPGEYKILAWTEVENGAWYDADFMRNYENRGTPIRMLEGGNQEVQVIVIQ